MSVSEYCLVGRHEEVAPERHLHAAGNRCPVDRPQHGLPQLGDLGNAVFGMKPFEIGSFVSLGLLEIEARTERRIGTCQYHSAHGSVAISIHQRGVQGADQIGVQCVSHLGTVHRQHPDRAVVLTQNELLVHDIYAATLGNSLSLTRGPHNSLGPRELDLLPAVQQRRRVALQWAG